jgi:hypothetical protein
VPEELPDAVEVRGIFGLAVKKLVNARAHAASRTFRLCTVLSFVLLPVCFAAISKADCFITQVAVPIRLGEEVSRKKPGTGLYSCLT